MAVNVTPLHDRVLVKRIEEKETVKGGIIIPDTAKEKPQEGEVIAVGAGKIEKGERPEDTIIRELREELGIVVREACLAPFVFASASLGLLERVLIGATS